MKIFIRYLRDYLRELRPASFILTTAFISIAIVVNYTIGIERNIRSITPWPLSFALFYIFYLFIFSTAYLFQLAGKRTQPVKDKKVFIALLLLAPAIFTLKVIHWQTPAFIINGSGYPWNKYLPVILQLPAKLLLLVLLLFTIWKWFYANTSFFGLSARNFKPAPYLQLLACAVPLILFASTQADFLYTYPKVKSIAFINGHVSPAWPFKLIYELSYGLDFISIELFFRGFLVLGFVRFVGVDAILPMAAFYCTIHFGKPLAECISSFFGGILLGVVVYRTKSILGGLTVHLGLAWLMEVGGYAGWLYFYSR